MDCEAIHQRLFQPRRVLTFDAVRRWSRQHRRKWIQIRNRNEALDCLVYAYAAAVSVGIARIDWDKLESQLFPAITEEIEPTEREVKKPVKERSRRGSGFVKGW